jgi:hypothetical protein
MIVIFRELGESEIRTQDISDLLTVLEFRKYAQTILGYDEQVCKVILERTSEQLQDPCSFKDLQIKDKDVLIIVPATNAMRFSPLDKRNFKSQSASEIFSKDTLDFSSQALQIPYKLILTQNSQEQSNWEYTIQLQSYHENNPDQFFSNSEGKEYVLFEAFLQSALQKQLLKAEVMKVLHDWCSEISQGYRVTSLKF